MGTEAESTILWRINTWFPELPPAAHAKLKAYSDELIKFNRTINLIPVKTIPVLDMTHFADSILAARLIFQDTNLGEITDLGSGNGFPGLVLAILFPSLKVNVVDADAKKCEFLRHIKEMLDLSNVNVIKSAIDKLPPLSVQYGVIRNLGTLTKSLLMTRKIVRSPGCLYHMKSDNWGIELAEIPSQLCSSFQPALLGEYKLPLGEMKFAVIKTSKLKND